MSNRTVVEGTAVGTCEETALHAALREAEHKVEQWKSEHPGNHIVGSPSVDLDHDPHSRLVTAKSRIRVALHH